MIDARAFCYPVISRFGVGLGIHPYYTLELIKDFLYSLQDSFFIA